MSEMAVEGGRPRRRKGMLSSPATWIIVLAVGLGVGGYLLWRRSQASTAAAATPSSTPTSEDFSGQIATLQAEVTDLQGALSQDSDTTTSTSGGTTGGTTKKPATPTGATGTSPSSSTIKLSWKAVTGATRYEATATAAGKTTPLATSTGTSVTISGLKANTSYTCHVAACNSAGCSASTTGPVVKTKKAGEPED